MLPGPNGVWATYTDGLAAAESTDAIRKQTVSGPISPTEDISGSYRRGPDALARRGVLGEKRPKISTKGQFCTALGSTVGVFSAHRVIFAVSPGPFSVLITLIAGYVNKDFDAW